MIWPYIFNVASLGFTVTGALFTFFFDPPSLDEKAVMDIAESMKEQPILMGMTSSEREQLWGKRNLKQIHRFRLSRAGFWFIVSGAILRSVGSLCR